MIKRALLSIGLLLLLATPASAAALSPALSTPSKQVAVCATGAANFFGIQPWHACLPKGDDGSPQMTSINDIFLIIFPVVEALVKIAVYVAIFYIFWMIIKIFLARGDSGKVAQASMGIRDAVIGMIIALIAVAIVNFIASAVTG